MKRFLSALLFIILSKVSIQGQVLSQTLNPFTFTHAKSLQHFQGSLYLSLSENQFFNMGPLNSYLYKLNATSLQVEDSVRLNDLIGPSDGRIMLGELKEVDTLLALAVSFLDSAYSTTCPIFHFSLAFFDKNLRLVKEIRIDTNRASLFLSTFHQSKEQIVVGGSMYYCDSAHAIRPCLALINLDNNEPKIIDLSLQLNDPLIPWEVFQPYLHKNRIYANIWNHKAPKFESNIVLDTNLQVIHQGSILIPNSGFLGNTLHRQLDFLAVNQELYQIGNLRSYHDSFIDLNNRYGYWNLAIAKVDSLGNLNQVDTLPLSGYDIMTSAEFNSDVSCNFDGMDYQNIDSVAMVACEKVIHMNNFHTKDTTAFYLYNYNFLTQSLNWSKRIETGLINSDQSIAVLPNNTYAISFNEYDWLSDTNFNLRTQIWLLDAYGNILSQQEFKTRPALSFYPNPVRDKIYFSQGAPQPRLLQIFSLQGALLQEKTLLPHQTELLVQGLAPGIYLLKMGDAVAKFQKVER